MGPERPIRSTLELAAELETDFLSPEVFISKSVHFATLCFCVRMRAVIKHNSRGHHSCLHVYVCLVPAQSWQPCLIPSLFESPHDPLSLPPTKLLNLQNR